MFGTLQSYTSVSWLQIYALPQQACEIPTRLGGVWSRVFWHPHYEPASPFQRDAISWIGTPSDRTEFSVTTPAATYNLFMAL